MAYLPRLAGLVAGELGPAASGDASAGARRRLHDPRRGDWPGSAARGPGSRLGLAWFDAHGDFNTPDTTPSGNVWGMPFAMICGRGEPDLVAACDGPTVREEDAALLGGQVLDETESRMLAASRVAHFGAGMLGDRRWPGGAGGLGADRRRRASTRSTWRSISTRSTPPATGRVAMPEPGGISLETAVAAVRSIAASGPVVGFGATAVLIGRGGDPERTLAAVASLAEAALGDAPALDPAAYSSIRWSFAAIAAKSSWLMSVPVSSQAGFSVASTTAA